MKTLKTDSIRRFFVTTFVLFCFITTSCIYPITSIASLGDSYTHNESGEATLQPESDFKEDLGIIGWGHATVKKLTKHVRKKKADLTIEDLFRVGTQKTQKKLIKNIFTEEGYAFDEIPDQETLIISGKDHGIIFTSSLYEPSVDILSSKKVLKKESLNAHVNYYIYQDIYVDLYNELKDEEFDLQNIAAYVPAEILQTLLEKEIPGDKSKKHIFTEPLVFENASVASIDLSGFTAMTDKLNSMLSEEVDPVKQAEARKFVIEITNELFVDIANVINKFDGSILKFGGDARLVMFTGENTATRALEMSQEVQLMIRYFGGIIKEFFTETADFSSLGDIKASIGMSTGTIYLVIPDDSYGIRDVLPLGDVVLRAIQAEDASNKEIVISQESKEKLVKEGRGNLFTVFDTDTLPDEKYNTDARKSMKEENLYVINQQKLNFLDYEVKDRINFTQKYMNAVYDYLRKNNFDKTSPELKQQITKDFEKWKKALTKMNGNVTIGDFSKIKKLENMKKAVMKIRIEVDNHLLSFFPAQDDASLDKTKDTLAKMSMKNYYGKYVADRIGILFHQFRTKAHRKAFYSKEILEEAKDILISFLPRGFDNYIIKDEKTDTHVDRMNFQNVRIMFMQVYGLQELYNKTLKENGLKEAQNIVRDFFNDANRTASPANGIFYLKCDPGTHYLKMIYLGGLKYISNINPDAEMVRHAMHLHETADKYGLKMKIGINSGAVILGLTGTARKELTTISPEINLAARLGSSSKKGETIVSSRVYYASKDDIDYKERTDFYAPGAKGIKVKGVAAEIPIFQPLGILTVQRKGKFLRNKELGIAKKWIDTYLDKKPGTMDMLFIQTKELGLGSETLAYEIERYAKSAGFITYGTRGKDEYAIMKNLLEDFFAITHKDKLAERLKKIDYGISEYAEDMKIYTPALKILFPFIDFGESEVVDNLEDDEKIIVINNIIQKLFTNKAKEVTKEGNAGLFLRVFDMQNLPEETVFFSPLMNSLKNKNVLIELVCNGAFPKALEEIEVTAINTKEPVSLAKLVTKDNRTILVDKMDQEQILDIFHGICGLKRKTALLSEVDRLTLDDIRGLYTRDEIDEILQHFNKDLPQEKQHTVISDSLLKDLHSYVKKQLNEKIYLLSGKGSPLIARHQAKLFTDRFRNQNLPEDQKGAYLLKEVLKQKISGDNIDAFFYTQYNASYFDNPLYKTMLLNALCLGSKFKEEVFIKSLPITENKVNERLKELMDIGIFRRGDLETFIFDHYIYDVFIKHADIDKIRKGKLKLAHLMETLYKKEDGSIDPAHINTLAQLYYDSFNLKLKWDKQQKELGVNEKDLTNTMQYLELSANKYEKLLKLPEAVNETKNAISVINYKKDQELTKKSDKKDLCKLYNNLGDMYKRLFNADSSLKAYNTALELVSNDTEKFNIIFDGIIQVLYASGNMKEIAGILNRVEKQIPKIEPLSTRKLTQTELFIKLGNLNFDKGNYESALSYYEKGKKIAANTNNIIAIIKIYNNIGNVLIEKGDLEKSKKSYLEAVRISKEIHNPFRTAGALSSLSINYILSGEPHNAIRTATESILILKKNHYTEFLTTSLNYCGEGYRLLGQYDKALGYYMDAERVVKLFGALAEEKADLYKGFGICYKKDHEKSIKYLQKAINEAYQIEDKKLSLLIMLDCWGYILEGYIRSGEISKAINLISEIQNNVKTFSEKITKSKDIKIRLGVIDRIKCEIDFIIHKDNEENLKNIFLDAIACFNNAKKLDHKLGIAKNLALLLKVCNKLNNALSEKKTNIDNSTSLKISKALSSLKDVENFLLKNKFPLDSLLLAELYYELSVIASVTKQSHLFEGITSLETRADYLTRTQNLIEKLAEEGVYDGRIIILQNKLLSPAKPESIETVSDIKVEKAA
ncbi:MAG: adenylate/guanylate cyclase domain-containing protein [Candidatus Ancaeobacter aquaticus]|nr:adenylate/guanylate cyclase domain-containing protein [Candidatus Ancaeobacter aquaticus]